MSSPVDAETLRALAKVAKVFKADFALMDEVLGFVQGLLTRGALPITKPRGLNQGVLMITSGILAKACKTVRAIRVAAAVGSGQDASILLRALFESTIALLWILQRDSKRRATLFAAHEDQRWLVIVEEHRKTPGLKRVFGKNALAIAQANVDRWRKLLKNPSQVDSVRKHWFGSGLRGATDALGYRSGWRRAYETLYRQTSAFSHGSDANAHLFQNPVTGNPGVKLLPGFDELHKVIPMACVLVLEMATRLISRLGMKQTDLDRAKELSRRSLDLAKKRQAMDRSATGQQPIATA